jgi:hypothetical protein
VDVTSGISGTPRDLGISETSDHTAIIYDVPKWRSYTNTYQTYSTYDTWSRVSQGIPPQIAHQVDVAPNWIHYSHELNGWAGTLCWCWSDWSGSWYESFYDLAQALVGYGDYLDIANLQGHSECWGLYDGHVTGYWNPTQQAVFHRETSAGSNAARYYYGAPFYNGTGSTGVVMANVKGIDLGPWVSAGTVDMYILEALPATNTAAVELWRVGSSAPVFQSAFGEGFLYHPLDITVDSAWNIFILEQKSNGSYVLWAFDTSGTLIGYSGELTLAQVSGTPLRIDAAVLPDPDQVHLLHTLGVTRFYMP